MGGARAGLGVTPECVKEVAEALSSMMSTGKVPKHDRALALEALLLEVLKTLFLYLYLCCTGTLFCTFIVVVPSFLICTCFCTCTLFCDCASCFACTCFFTVLSFVRIFD